VDAEGEPDVLTRVGSLVEKSLLRREGTDEPRFRMLETVREYAAECLAADGPVETIRRRHADHYSALAGQGALELSGPRHTEWSHRLEQEHDNLRAVLEWYGTNGEFESGLRLAVALMRFWQLRGHLSEGRRWLEGFLAGTQSPSLRAVGLCAVGRLAETQVDYDSSLQSLEEALTLARENSDAPALSQILHSLGWVRWGIPDRALALFEECRIEATGIGDNQLLARVLFDEALHLVWSGDIARAKVLAEESLALYRQAGDEQGAAVALEILSGVAYREGEIDRAQALGGESSALLGRAGLGPDFLQATELMSLEARDRGNYRQAELLLEMAMAMSEAGSYRPYRVNFRRLLGLIARERGAYERATQLLEESLAELRDMHDGLTCAMAMVGLSDVARDLGDVGGAVDWCETTLASTEHTRYTYAEGWALYNLGLVAGQQDNYGRAYDLLDRALAIGSSYAPGYRAEILSGVGWVALDEGDERKAVTAFAESLQLGQSSGPAWLMASCLEGVASAVTLRGQSEQAARIFGAAEAMRDRIGAPIWPSRRATYDRYRCLARDALGEERFRTIYHEGRAMSETEAIAYVLERSAALPTDVAVGKQPA
jgi:tetratricopeptide (TPR) repeat protein